MICVIIPHYNSGIFTILISVIIPILKRDKPLPAALRCLLEQNGEAEIVVALGEQARAPKMLTASGRVTITTEAGSTRGALLNRGAAAATGEVLLFLWPDCRLPPTALTAITQNLTLLPATIGGNFHVQFDEDSWFTRFVAHLLKQLRYRGHYYGNSAMFVRRSVFDEIGGFEPDEILEDYVFARRLERYGPTLYLPDTVIAASHKFIDRKFMAAGLWLAIQLLFWLGIRPVTLARTYQRL